MRPSTPKLNVSHSVGQTSPPQTPRTASPAFNRKASPETLGFPPKDPMSQRPQIRPLGNGPHFSYTRSVGPEQLSPRSSNSGSDDDSEAISSQSASRPPSSMPGGDSRRRWVPPVVRERIVTEATFVLEELSDSDDDDDEEGRLEIIQPYTIEYAESDRSRSRSRPNADLDRNMMYDLKNLNCSSGSEEDSDDREFREMVLKRRAERHRRMTSGSIGKRTITESIGSDSDREDLKLDASDVGSSARRLRRRLGDRRSLLFQDPPPRIDEETIDEWDDGEALARELPYYTLEYISMEVDSP